jgi:hypothetical protein
MGSANSAVRYYTGWPHSLGRPGLLPPSANCLVERIQRFANLPPISALRFLSAPLLFDVPVENRLAPIAFLLA